MDSNDYLLFITTFLATGIEMIEVLAIVLGVGVARGWAATLAGVFSAVCLLVGIVSIVGQNISEIPIEGLRAIIGILLLLFGVQWLRKGIVRISQFGFKPRPSHLRTIGKNPGGKVDWTAFILAFKGVLLEGLEVVFIVISFGIATDRIGLASLSAASSLVLTLAFGLLLKKLVQNLPAHVIKFAVGLLLVSFGTFWAAEGIGIKWPGEDLSILALLAAYGVFSIAGVYLLGVSSFRNSSEQPLDN